MDHLYTMDSLPPSSLHHQSRRRDQTSILASYLELSQPQCMYQRCNLETMDQPTSCM